MFKMYEELIVNRVKENMEIVKSLEFLKDEIQIFAGICCSIFSKNQHLYIMGNGGSAADAQHIAGELVGRFGKERRGLSAIALTTDTSILTAWSNDYDYSTVFARQVEALAKPGDALFGLSTSGNSTNIIKAFEKGNEIETVNLSFTGNNGGKIKELSRYNINIDSSSTPRIQEAHQVAYHIVCELIEEQLFK